MYICPSGVLATCTLVPYRWGQQLGIHHLVDGRMVGVLVEQIDGAVEHAQQRVEQPN